VPIDANSSLGRDVPVGLGSAHGRKEYTMASFSPNVLSFDCYGAPLGVTNRGVESR